MKLYLPEKAEKLWGIFLSRYNPTSSELFFGIGPFQFPKLYSEINIKSITVPLGEIKIQREIKNLYL